MQNNTTPTYRIQIPQGNSYEELGPLGADELLLLAQKKMLSPSCLYFDEASHSWKAIQTNSSLCNTLFPHENNSLQYDVLIENPEKPALKEPQKLDLSAIINFYKLGKIKPDTLVFSSSKKSFIPLQDNIELFKKVQNPPLVAPPSFFEPSKTKQDNLPKEEERPTIQPLASPISVKQEKITTQETRTKQNNVWTKVFFNIFTPFCGLLLCLSLYSFHAEDIFAIRENTTSIHYIALLIQYPFLLLLAINAALWIHIFLPLNGSGNSLIRFFVGSLIGGLAGYYYLFSQNQIENSILLAIFLGFVLTKPSTISFTLLKNWTLVTLGYLSYLYLNFGYNFSLLLVSIFSLCLYFVILPAPKKNTTPKQTLLLTLSTISGVLLCLFTLKI